MAGASSDKKGSDIVIVDMRRMRNVCDYFVISSGRSTTQVVAIADSIEKKMSDKGERLRHKEGSREAMWVLLDYGDVVAHVFLEETRRFYDLERLWSEAPQSRFREAHPKAVRKLRLGAGRKKALRLKPRAKKGKNKRSAPRRSGRRR